MLVASLASIRDVMSAGWPSLSFAAWAVGNTACSLVWRRSRLQQHQAGLQGQMPENSGTPASGQTQQECLMAYQLLSKKWRTAQMTVKPVRGT